MRENYKLFKSTAASGINKKISSESRFNFVPEGLKLNSYRISGRFLFMAFLFLLVVSKLSAQTNDDCLTCHDDPSLSKERAGKKVSLYIKPQT